MSITPRLRRIALGLATAALLASAQSPALAQAASPGLPGGASSLQETYSDWQVGCVVRDGSKRCAITQEQANQQTRQRVIAIELTIAGDKLQGMLFMPFGLALDRGASLQIDDQTGVTTSKFSTCLPGGCLVPLSFDTKTIASMRTGTALKVRATPAGGGQELVYPISLKGFAQGIDRVSALMK